MAAAELAISTKSGVNFWRGIGIAQLALASWTAFAILNSAWLKPHPEVNATDWAHLFGVATGLGALVMRLVSGSSIQALTARDDLLRLAVLYLLAGFGSTWMAAIFWIWPASGLAPAYAAS